MSEESNEKYNFWLIIGIVSLALVLILSLFSNRQLNGQLDRLKHKFETEQEHRALEISESIKYTYQYCVENKINESYAKELERQFIFAEEKCLFEMVQIYGTEKVDEALDIDSLTKKFIGTEKEVEE